MVSPIPNHRQRHLEDAPLEQQYLSAPQEPEAEEDQLTQACNNLKFHLASFGYSDIGNLRSSKKKDVRLRLKVINGLLKQR